jgi:pyruvate/2-oxoglutarate dehydrogenase complex dihydrolipoamide acyltransferase (E2) component
MLYIMYEIKMPGLSAKMDKGTIVAWRVNEEDKINPGNCICEIEIGEKIFKFEYPKEGYVAKILKPVRTKDIRVGEVSYLS